MAFLPLNHVVNKQLRNCLFTTWFSGEKAMLTAMLLQFCMAPLLSIRSTGIQTDSNSHALP